MKRTADEIRRRGEDARSLRESAAFARFLKEVRDEQLSTFLTATQVGEDVHHAHSILRALVAIEAKIAWALAEAEKLEKGQHLGRD